MPNSAQRRRRSDVNPEQIEDMIRQENDPKTRGVLIIVQSMVVALSSVTDFLRDMDAQFSLHKNNYEIEAKATAAILLKGQLLYRVALSLVVVLQGAIVGVGAYAFKEVADIHDASIETRYHVEQLDTQVRELKLKNAQ